MHIYFDESQLSKDQTIQKLENGLAQITATVPFTSQLVWWLEALAIKFNILNRLTYLMRYVQITD